MFRRMSHLFPYTAVFFCLLLFLIVPVAARAPLLSDLSSPPKNGADDTYTIKLRSREFTPTPGFSALERQRLEAAARAAGDKGSPRIHALVQLVEIPSPAEQAAFADQGIQLLTYIPNRAWVAAIPGDELARVAATPGVRWLGELRSDDKLAPEIREGRFGDWHYDAERDVVAVVIELHDDVDLSVARDLIPDNGGIVRDYVPAINSVMAEMPRRALRTLAADDRVLWVETALPSLTPTNDGIRTALNVNVLHPAPYNTTPTYSLDGTGIDALVYDAGQVSNHPDFGTRLTHGDTTGVEDHSTHVAGTLGADGSQSATHGGTAWQWRGVAPNVDIISYGYEWNNTGRLFVTNMGDINNDWNAAKNTHGADLGTASLGSNVASNNYPCNLEGNYGQTSQLIDNIVRGSLGEPYIATWSAGNERGGRCDGTQYTNPLFRQYRTTPPPSCAKNPIHVGATNSNDNSMTTFSSWGPCDDGRLKPVVVAPGGETGNAGIVSTMAVTVTTDSFRSGCPIRTPGDGNDDFFSPYTNSTGPGSQAPACEDVWEGTSMATPAVAGVVTLMLQQYRTTYNTSGEFLPSTAKAILINTATDLGTAGPDFQFGYGLVNARAAVDAVINGLFREGTITTNGQVDWYVIQVPAGTTRLQVSLAWDDPGVAPLTTPALRNNLDLALLDPAGGLHRPWVLNANNPTNAAAAGVDNLNNQEQVTINNPAAGAWRVRVTGTTVPSAPQRYSLAATRNLFSLNIVNPTQLAPAHVGLYSNPEKLLISLDLSDRHGGRLGTTINATSDLSFSIGGAAPASVLPGGNVGNRYWVLVTPPTKTAAGCHNLQVTLFGRLTDTEANAVCYDSVPVRNEDVMLVIDSSGSMGWSNKMPATKDAAKFFVTAINNNDMIGMDTFSTTARLKYSLTTVTGATEKNAANNAINALVAGGWTALGSGAQIANTELTTHGNSAHDHTMVILSDGRQNRTPMWATISGTIPVSTVIHTVALGPAGDPDEALLSNIATTFHGSYYRVPTGGPPLYKAAESTSLASNLRNILADVYRRAAEQTYEWQRLWEASGQVGGNCENFMDSYEVYVESNLSEAVFAVHWSPETGTSNPLELVRPDGSTVNPGDPDVLEHRLVSDISSGHEQYRMAAPADGYWTVNIHGGDVACGEYVAMLEARSQTQLFLLSPPGQRFGLCEDVPILALFMGRSEPVLEATVWAELVGPHTQGEVFALDLFDDGGHGDGDPDDGLYGNTYYPCAKSSAGALQADGAGSYQIKVTGVGINEDGEPVERSVTGAYYATESTTSDPPPPATILLVDDDDNDPDVRSFYTDALDGIGASYDVWDVANDGPPAPGNLSPYHTVIWFTGDDLSTTLDAYNEEVLASFLENGGKLFLSSQDYYWDVGLTPFMQNYLRIDAVQQEVDATSVRGVAGNAVGDGLGPYFTSIPSGFAGDYSDQLTPGPGGDAAFVNQSDATIAVSFTDGNYCTLFAAFPFEFLGSGDAQEVMKRILDWPCWDPGIEVWPPEVEGSLWAGSVVTKTTDVFNPGQGKLAWTVNRGPIHLWAVTDADGVVPSFLSNLDPTLVTGTELVERGGRRAQAVSAPQAVSDDVRLDVCAVTSSVADCCGGSTCSPDALLDQDVLIIYSDQPFADPVGLGDMLADYVDQGGTVIVAMNALIHGAEGLAGRFMDQDYSPLKSAGDVLGTTSLGDYDPGHPLMNGVSSASALWHLDVFTTGGDTETVAFWDSGAPFVAIKRLDPAPVAGRVIAINAPLDDGTWEGDVDEIVTNAIQWLADNIRTLPWLDPVCSFSPPPGPPFPTGTATAPAGVSAVGYTCPLVDSGGDWTLTLNFDGSAFAADPAYLLDRPVLRGKVTIEHNVSDQERVNIPVTAYLGCGLADTNCNGEVDIGDIQAIAGHWGTPPGAEYYYDLNDDGTIDLNDIQMAADLWRTMYAQ